MTISIMTFIIMTLSIKDLFATLIIIDDRHYNLFLIMLNVVMLSVIILNVVAPFPCLTSSGGMALPRNSNWRGRISTVYLRILSILNRLLLIPKIYQFLSNKTSYLYEEVNRTKPSFLVRVPWPCQTSSKLTSKKNHQLLIYCFCTKTANKPSGFSEKQESDAKMKQSFIEEKEYIEG